MSMNPVNVADFKAHLGRYLKRVREGKPVTVADRGRPIATVVPYEESTRIKLSLRKPLKDPAGLARLSFPPLAGAATDIVALLLDERRDKR